MVGLHSGEGQYDDTTHSSAVSAAGAKPPRPPLSAPVHAQHPTAQLQKCYAPEWFCTCSSAPIYRPGAFTAAAPSPCHPSPRALSFLLPHFGREDSAGVPPGHLGAYSPTLPGTAPHLVPTTKTHCSSRPRHPLPACCLHVGHPLAHEVPNPVPYHPFPCLVS